MTILILKITFKINMVMVTESGINRHHSVMFEIYHFYDVGEDGNVKFSTRPDSEPANRRHNTCIIHRLTVVLRVKTGGQKSQGRQT